MEVYNVRYVKKIPIGPPANRFGVQFGKEIGFPITMRRWLSCDCHLAGRRRDGTKEADTDENARETISSRSELPSRFLATKALVEDFSRGFLAITPSSLRHYEWITVSVISDALRDCIIDEIILMFTRVPCHLHVDNV